MEFSKLKWAGLLLFHLLVLTGCNTQVVKSEMPNIIVILADDMGFSDVGSFGAEFIQTPNLDRLAEEGLIMTQFYNAARCCPSRASLLTGQYPHTAGMGGMTDQDVGVPSHYGYLPDNVITISEVLSQNGYHTYTSGKWHIGDEESHRPMNYGFDHCFSFINGAGSYFDNKNYRNKDWPWGGRQLVQMLDNEEFEYPDSGIYKTDLFTDYALEYIQEASDGQKPFFLYLAYTAPHWPLHALPEDIAKYKGVFDVGWDSLRLLRFQNQIESGLIDPKFELSGRTEGVPAWNSLDLADKEKYTRMMEVYAAMIDRMDQNIGRVISQLEKTGQNENTLILFLSDNGGCRGEFIPFLEDRFSPQAPIGSPESFIGYGKGWANASNTPFRYYKAQLYEGGIASPFIAWYPGVIDAGQINHSIGHIIDIMATCVDISGATYPERKQDQELVPLPVKSFMPLFLGETFNQDRALGFEHFDNMAIRRGKWKMVRLSNGDWELYDMENDRTETRNLIKVADDSLIMSLVKDYNLWMANVGVIPQDIVSERTK